jgi:hypothetical protein
MGEDDERSAVSQCEEIIHQLMAEPRYRNVTTQLNGSNLLMKCRICTEEGTEGRSRAFLEINPTQITFCANRIAKSHDSYRQMLSHELTHAYDYLTGKCDFETCDGLAYSEVRAAREGECSGYFIHHFFRQKCIRDHAIRSTAVSDTDTPDLTLSSVSLCLCLSLDLSLCLSVCRISSHGKPRSVWIAISTGP